MTEENGEKKNWKFRMTEWIANKTLAEIKNQLAELKAADNIGEININVNVETGDRYYTTPVTFPDNTKPRDVAKLLDKWNYDEPPKLSKIKLDENDEKWIADNFTTVVNSSAATLSTVARFEPVPHSKGKLFAKGEPVSWDDEKVEEDD